MPEMRTERLEARVTPETKARIAELGRSWGGEIRPLSITDVVDEAVRRAWEAEKRWRGGSTAGTTRRRPPAASPRDGG